MQPVWPAAVSLLASDKTGTLTQVRRVAITYLLLPPISTPMLLLPLPLLLLQNVMTVVNVVLGPAATIIPVADLPTAPRPDLSSAAAASSSGAPSALERLVRAAALCNDSVVKPPAVDFPTGVAGSDGSGAEPTPRLATTASPAVVVGGNGTDKALMEWALARGGAADLAAWSRVLCIPFSSVTKQVRADALHFSDARRSYK